MVIRECKYNPDRDIQAVDQFGFIDIVKANQESAIDVPLQLVEEAYNDIDDPRSIGARPQDVFEEMQANKAIVGYKPKNKRSVTEQTS